MTELIYLDSTRPWALKVFETLIINGFDHQTDVALHGLCSAEDEESQVKGVGPQSFSKFYEDLKEACLNSKCSISAGIKWNHGGAYLNIINLFLCMAFLCISKEADCDRDSSNDIEDASDNVNTASEPLGGGLSFLLPDRVALSSKEHLRRAADVWSVCHRVYLVSPVFQKQLFRLGGLKVCYQLMTMALQILTLKIKEDKSKKKSDSKSKISPHSACSALNPVEIVLEAMVDGTHVTQQLDLNHSMNPGHMEATVPAQKLEEEWLLQGLHLLEALLSICLHNSKSVLQKPEYNISFQVLNIQFLTK